MKAFTCYLCGADCRTDDSQYFVRDFAGSHELGSMRCWDTVVGEKAIFTAAYSVLEPLPQHITGGHA